jgi:hypothetical protein
LSSAARNERDRSVVRALDQGLRRRAGPHHGALGPALARGERHRIHGVGQRFIERGGDLETREEVARVVGDALRSAMRRIRGD